MSASDHSSHEHHRHERTLVDRVRALFGLGAPSIRDDIEDALEDASTDSDFTPQERSMLKNVLGLHELRVQDIMVPRADIVAVSLEDSLADVLKVFRTAGHSRLPVHGETLDDPRGMVHIRDFVDYLAGAMEGVLAPLTQAEDRSPRRQAIMRLRGMGELDLSLPLSKSGVVRPVLFVPPSMPALDLLVKMQTTRTHMALVIDEYGGTDGLASIEDIVETIVGDIEDEHDTEESPKIARESETSWLVDARAGLDELAATVDFDFEALASDDNVDTIGGLVSTLAGRVPARGETIEAEQGVQFDILDADRRRVKRLRIRMQPAPDPAEALHQRADAQRG